MITEDQLVEAI